MKKWITVIIVVIVLAVGTTWFFSKKGETKDTGGVVTRTATVEKGTLVSNVSGSGKLVPAVDEDVKASDTKTIDEVLVTANEKVKKDQQIVTFTDGSDPITAPASGTITQVNVYDGDRVNPGKAVAHLTNYTDLNTVIQVDELDIPKVKDKQQADIKVNAYPDKSYKGTVKSIARTGSVTNGVSSFDVTVHLSGSSGLKPGMTTTANITTNKKSNALIVPVEAVHKMNNQYYVLVPTSNKASGQSGQSNQSNQSGHRNSSRQTGQTNANRVMVKTGINNDSEIEIVSGVSEGTTVELPPIVMSSSQNQSQGTNAQMRQKMFGGGGGFGGGGQGGSFSGGRRNNG